VSCYVGCDDDSYTVSPRPGSSPNYFAAARNVDPQDISEYVTNLAYGPQEGRVAFVGTDDPDGRHFWVAVGTLVSPGSGTLTSVAPVIKEKGGVTCPGHYLCSISSPSWSPTGRRLLYERLHGSNGRMIEVDLASGRTSRIGPVFKAVDDLEPDWASTGEIVLSPATARVATAGRGWWS
jgi:hypothetical protein